MKKISQKVIQKLFGFESRNTHTTWKKDNKRIILRLIIKYFNQDDLQEFIANEKVSRLDSLILSGDITNHIVFELENICKQELKKDDSFLTSFIEFTKSIDVELYNEIKNLSFNSFIESNHNIYSTIQMNYSKYLIFIDSNKFFDYTNNLLSFYNQLHFDTYKFAFIQKVMWTIDELTVNEKKQLNKKNADALLKEKN